MTDIQRGLLCLLKEIDAICQKYQIEYYLGGGTLVGAIRHSGFLPWDDDADIHMSWGNATKFIEAVKKENKPNREMYYAPFGGGYRTTLLRYENVAITTYLRSYVGKRSLIKGQFIDIFINYPLPTNQKKAKRCIEEFELYSELRIRDSTFSSLRSKKFLREYSWCDRLRNIIGHENLMRYFEKRIFGFQEDKADEWFIGSPMLPEKITAKYLWGKPRYVPFEDTMLPVAEHAETILSNAYGPTWFEIPPNTERGSHVFIVDEDVPYAVYDADIDKRFKTDKFSEEEVRKKKVWMSILSDRNVVMPRIRQLQGMCTSMEVQKTINDRHINLRDPSENGKEELDNYFSPFYAKYNLDTFKYYGVYIDMPDEYLYAALYFRCFDGNYGLAKKVLNQRRTCVDRELSPDLRRLCDICDATDEMLTALYGDLDMERTRELVDEWLEKEPTALYFQRADMNLRLSIDRRGESAEELLRRCEGYLEQYPDDGELLKYKGDILLELGEKDKGEKCYKIALCSLKNGFCVKAIKEYFAQI